MTAEVFEGVVSKVLNECLDAGELADKVFKTSALKVVESCSQFGTADS